MPVTCSETECGRPHFAKGLCSRHYSKQRASRAPIPANTPKTCRTCGQAKFASDFSKHGGAKDGLRPECRSCHSKFHKEQRAKNGRDRYRRYELKRKYGITLEKFNEMLAAQDGKCAICGGVKSWGERKALCVDHNHETGAVRAILCNSCNAGIGDFRESPELLTKAIQYLAKFRRDEV